ncbi:hypothetical protein BDV96DRAFT_498011, partial [Lophiotrema nucula]
TMAAASAALADRHILGRILHLLSDMRYKDRRQRGPDQPVELLEFRPTLVPCVLVNKFWADEATSVLWKRYPHLPALKNMTPERRQYYANKVHQIFSLGPPPGHPENMEYLDGLRWPGLKSLEIEIDFSRHGARFLPMLHKELEHLELSGEQGGGPAYFTNVVLPGLFANSKKLKSLRFGAGLFPEDEPVHASELFQYLDAIPTITTVEVKAAGFMAVDSLFTRLSQRPGLEVLEIDLEPGFSLLPQLQGPNALLSPFSSLKRLFIMCYPEIALSLPAHLHHLEELQMDICRIPNQPARESDFTILEDLIVCLSSCPQLRLLKVGIGLLAVDFPSFSLFPRLSGPSLVQLAAGCPILEDIYLFATEPSAIDGTAILAADCDKFCQTLPGLKKLSLKLHPSTALALEHSALQSLGTHCKDLEILRMKIAFQLPSMSTPSTVPEILIEGSSTPRASDDLDANSAASEASLALHFSDEGSLKPTSESSFADFVPLFPKLKHLAIARPESILAIANETFTLSSASFSDNSSSIVDPELEEDLVRAWAQPLLAHFPSLEILEAWGDWMGQDNESLNYFLPTEEILASTWEFLSGAEQDLWDDDNDDLEYDELVDGDNWEPLEHGDDWDKASYVESFIASEDYVRPESYIEEEVDGMITPGRTPNEEDYFPHPEGKLPTRNTTVIHHSGRHEPNHSLQTIPTEELNNLNLS